MRLPSSSKWALAQTGPQDTNEQLTKQQRCSVLFCANSWCKYTVKDLLTLGEHQGLAAT
jgi:hypothetical protein